jgi:glycosyltransferase involved in cell wall biosynthesis
MKILLASSSSGSRGGGELYFLYLGRALAERGHSVSLWASSHPRMDELACSFATIGPVLRASYRNTYDRPGRSLASYLDFATPRRIAREWRAAQPDFIHVNKQNLEDGLDLLRAADQCRIANLCTIHLTQSASYLRAQFASVRDFVARRALRRYPGMLVTVLDHRRRDLVKFLGDAQRVKMVANGVPLSDLRQRPAIRSAKRAELGLRSEDLLFIAVGRMVPQKRPLAFLQHAEQVLKVIPNAKFLWLGDGALAGEWDAWVAAKGLPQTIRRLSWQRDVPSFLLAADVFLHVAEFEGLPLAILEAMSAALPCAITENLLSEMPFLNAQNSIAIGSRSTWLEPLRDRRRLDELATAARALAEAEFSFGKMAARCEALYDEALAARA